MGNRDKRGREKKKPKKTEAKPVIRPYRPIVDSKPTTAPTASPAAPTPTETKV